MSRPVIRPSRALSDVANWSRGCEQLRAAGVSAERVADFSFNYGRHSVYETPAGEAIEKAAADSFMDCVWGK
jgi:hypothetical protein